MIFVIAIFFQAVNPIPLTIIAALLLLWLFRRVSVLRKHWKRIASVALLLYAVDLLFAIPRVYYAYSSPAEYEVLATARVPKELVLVNLGCDRICADLFIDGTIETITRVQIPRLSASAQKTIATRYRAAWKKDHCDESNFHFASFSFSRAELLILLERGFCPIAEKVETPTTGIFIVSNAYGGAGSTPMLRDRPLAWNAEYAATEVQERSADGVKLLAKTRFVEMSGPIGPLVGYWEPRGDFATFPRGAKGWGFWRPIISRGDYRYLLNMKWIFEHVLPARK